MQTNYDVLIIGSGVAGLTCALHLADHLHVAIIAKSQLSEGSTFYAQGGIAAVLDKKDTLASHIEDTRIAGAGLCHSDTVAHVVKKGKSAIHWLIEQGVAFSVAEHDFPYHLTKEGGHSHRRVIHAADTTGKEVESNLEKKVRQHPHIHVFEQHIAIDLITSHKLYKRQDTPNYCIGAYILNTNNDTIITFQARCTVLATGGASKVYLYTSNPDTSTGDGIAMAWRAGCRVANMEFNQFHPTCLYHPKAKSFLISEAVRGEGGKLLLPDGSPFMSKFDPRAELAPRDIVARAIDHEMKRLGSSNVLLDISFKGKAFIQKHFPNIYQRCLTFGFDITQEAIPVVPAAHYTCGGIMSDLHAQTDIQYLYAIGETAFSGLHGANRMASNSILECLVFAKTAAEHILQHLHLNTTEHIIPSWDASRVTDSDEEVVVSHNWDELRRFMWDYVGIVRTNKRLARAKRRIDLLLHEIDDYYGNFYITSDLLELRNLATVADLIIQSAQQRKESRGLHYTLDYSSTVEDSRYDTVLTPHNFT